MPELIEREKALKNICKYCSEPKCKENGCMVFAGIKDTPTVEAEPVRHGRWIPHKITSSSMCSECKKYAAFETPRCPHCGARMDGGADNG